MLRSNYTNNDLVLLLVLPSLQSVQGLLSAQLRVFEAIQRYNSSLY
jgi:hypothetical protein